VSGKVLLYADSRFWFIFDREVYSGVAQTCLYRYTENYLLP